MASIGLHCPFVDNATAAYECEHPCLKTRGGSYLDIAIPIMPKFQHVVRATREERVEFSRPANVMLQVCGTDTECGSLWLVEIGDQKHIVN